MKKLASVAALSLLAVAGYAQAAGGFSGQGHIGTISGTANSVSTGNSVVATQVNGTGFSTQTSFGNTGGEASVGVTFNHDSTLVVTSTRQYADSQSYGHVSGGAPVNVGNSIANGGATFESTTTDATGNATFKAASFGGSGGIQGIGALGQIVGFSH